MVENDGSGGTAVLGRYQRDADKGIDRQPDFHPHPANCTTQYDAIAVEFDLPHLPIRPDIPCRKSNWQSEGVEPHSAARPGRQGPAGFHLTPQLLPRTFSSVMSMTLPQSRRKALKKLG